MLKKLSTLVSAVILTFASTAQAEEGFYYGVGAGVSMARSGAVVFPASSNDTYGYVGITGGYRWELENSFIAAEIEADLSAGSAMLSSFGTSCSVFATGPYYCSHNSTFRARAMLGTTLNSDYEIFGTLGLVQINGTSAITPITQANNTNIGFTVGVGIQRETANGIVRLELVHDVANNSIIDPFGNNPSFRSTSLKFSYLFNLR